MINSTSHHPSGYRKNSPRLKEIKEGKNIGFFKKFFKPKKQDEAKTEINLTLRPQLNEDLIQRIKNANEVVENAKAELSKKTTEFEQTKLESSISAIESQISALQSEIENSENKLLTGELSTENLLRIRAEIRTHESNLTDLKAAQDLQHTVLDNLYRQLEKANKELGHCRAEVKQQLVKMLLADFVTKHRAELDDIFKAVGATRFFHVQNLYSYNGFSAFKEKFSDAFFDVVWNTIPSKNESYAFVEKNVEMLINYAIQQSENTIDSEG